MALLLLGGFVEGNNGSFVVQDLSRRGIKSGNL